MWVLYTLYIKHLDTQHVGTLVMHNSILIPENKDWLKDTQKQVESVNVQSKALTYFKEKFIL